MCDEDLAALIDPAETSGTGDDLGGLLGGTSPVSEAEVLDTDFNPYLELPYVVSDPLDDGFVPAEHFKLAELVLGTIRDAGIVDGKLALQEGEESELLTQALTELNMEVSFEARGYVLQSIYRAVQHAIDAGPLLKRSRGEHLPAGMARVWDARNAIRDGITFGGSSSSSSSLPPVPLLFPKKGRRLRITVAGSFGSTVITKAERDVARMREVQDRLAVLLLEGGTPVALQAASSADQRRTLADQVGKTRVNTARGYLRKWEIMREWMLSTKGLSWPIDAAHLVDYIHVLAEEPCRPTVPQSWHQSVSWMYRVGGFQLCDDPSRMSIVQKAVDRLTVTLGVNLQPVLQAARLPGAVLAALELYISNNKYPKFKRIHAGSLLFRSWGTLRFDDLQHIQRKTLRVIAGVLQTYLTSSKTSGPGKRISQLPIAVGCDAELLDLHWVVTWLGLVQTHLPLDRDYLLDMCTGDYERSIDRELTYTQSAALTRVVICELCVPTRVNGKWNESSARLMPIELLGFFTEHGPRAVLPSIAVIIESDKTKRDMLGRWCPSGSDDYARTHRAVVVGIQTLAAQSLKRGEGATRLHEDDVVERAHRFLVERRSFSSEIARGIVTKWKAVLDCFSVLLGTTTEAQILDECLPVSTLVPQLPFKLTPREQVLHKERGQVVREGRFMVTYNRSGNKACLHKVAGGCFWAGKELLDVQIFEEVDSTMYSKRCKFCFPKPLVKPEDSSSSSCSDSD